ncbi:MAG: hypothetical protein U0792_11640 [Gemmataceae bacterium]
MSPRSADHHRRCDRHHRRNPHRQQVGTGGLRRLRAKISTDAWLSVEKAVKLDIDTTTLDGEGQAAKGTIKVFTLKQPAAPVRGEVDGGRYWWRPVKENEEPKPDPAKPISWELGDIAYSGEFNTNGNGKADTSVKLGGIYRAIVETTDKFGKKVSTKYQFTVVNLAATVFPVKVTNYVNAPKWSLEPGEEFHALGHWLRRGPCLRGSGTPGQPPPVVLDRSRQDAGDRQAEGERGDAGRIPRPHHVASARTGRISSAGTSTCRGRTRT